MSRHEMDIRPSPRQGRGSKGPSLQKLSTTPLQSVPELLNVANSDSTKTNIRRARTVLEHYAKIHNAPDPKEVTKSSSALIVNMLAQYCGLDSEKPLSASTMLSLCQGLRHIYRLEGHMSAWSVSENGTATGNPLTGNVEIEELYRTHRVRLARLGRTPIKAQPLTIFQVSSHAEQFWYGSCESSLDPRDIELHAIMVLGLNMGTRYDEIRKLQVGNVTVDGGNIKLNLTISIKNSTVERIYSLHEWPKNTSLSHSIYMDPNLALLCWLMVRGSDPGPLFCNISMTSGGGVIDPTSEWESSSFQEFLRLRLRSTGVGEGDTVMYTGHSLKRGCVQLYRSLGYRDEYIMELIQMNGPNAYYTYCSAYNSCAPDSLPRFSGRKDFLLHAESVAVSGEFDE